MHRYSNARGFTLIELLVVIAIISLLIGILLPAIGRARDTARGLVCATNQRGIGQAMFQYTLENRDFYPGPNTSGAAYRFIRPGGDLYGMHSERTSSTPTTVWDWFSPMLGDSLNLSPNRAERTAQIFNDYGCAASNFFNDKLFGGWVDRPDFQRVLNEEGFLQISYLTPAPFHYYSSEWGGQAPVIPSNGPQTPQYWTGFRDPVTTPKAFRPSITRVGTSPSAKIFVADGTRYLAAEGNSYVLDFDISPTSDRYSSFGSQTPIRELSTAYGRGFHPNTDLNVELSIRHNDTVNAVYFDGHVASMTKSQMYTDPNPWHPTGSIFTGRDATPESIEFMEDQQGNRDEARIY